MGLPIKMSVQQLSLEFSFVLPLCSVLSLWQSGNPVLTLTDLPDEVCYGETYQINCSHPPLGGSSGYLGGVLWRRNGVDYTPNGITEQTVIINSTMRGLQINVIRGVYEPGTYYNCFIVRSDTFDRRSSNNVSANVRANNEIAFQSCADYLPFDREKSNSVSANVSELASPSQIELHLRIFSISLTWDHNPSVCFEDYTFSFIISWCTVENGVPDVSTCISTTTSTTNIALSNLVPSTTYQVNITAQSVEDSTIRSDTVEMGVTTLNSLFIMISKNPVCYDRQVQLTCHHHDITDTTSSGPIFNQTSPILWMKDGERINLPDAYHMNVFQSNTETVVSVTTRKSVFLNGEANYSCAVVYADGSMDESESVRVRTNIPSESPLPPTSLTTIPSDTSSLL